MEAVNFIQRKKIGVAGSFSNQMMGNNATIPEIGKGATELMYSDRECYEVVEVSENKKTARLQCLKAVWDKSKPGGIGHQNWILEPTEKYITVVYRYGSWYTKVKSIDFTKQFRDECESKGIEYIGTYLRKNNPELAYLIYGDQEIPQNVVEGITMGVNVYSKISIIFGIKDYHYDWSF